MAKEGEQDVPPCHVPDCTLTVDIVMKTSDGKYFGTHLQNLENYAEGFPPESLGKRKRVNHFDVEEGSEVVSWMLRLMHKQPQPDLRKIPIRVLIKLAEAVEKYLVFSAMSTCRILMGDRAQESPLPILAYGIKFNYHDVVDLAAPYTISYPWKAVRQELGLGGVGLWGEYRESYLSLFREEGMEMRCHRSADTLSPVCGVSVSRHVVLVNLFRYPDSIIDQTFTGGFDEEFVFKGCADCGQEWDPEWLAELRDMAKALPKFSTLL